MPANSGHSSARGRRSSKGREAHPRPRPGTCPADPALEPWAGLCAALASPLPERVLRTPPSGRALPRRRPSLMGGRRAVSRTSLTPRPRAPTPQLSGPHPFRLLLLWGPLLMPLVSRGGSGCPGKHLSPPAGFGRPAYPPWSLSSLSCPAGPPPLPPRAPPTRQAPLRPCGFLNIHSNPRRLVSCGNWRPDRLTEG